MINELEVGQLYEIFWTDAFLLTAWTSLEDAKKETCVCKTVGYFVGVTESGDLLLAATLGHDGELGAVQGRPAGMVKEIYKLQRENK